MIDLISCDTLNDLRISQNVFLIDVREPLEFQHAHIEGACLLPLSTFEVSLVPTQNKPIVVYCRSGARSAHVCELLKSSSQFKEVYNLEGGILRWQNQGYPVIK